MIIKKKRSRDLTTSKEKRHKMALIYFIRIPRERKKARDSILVI